MTLTLTETISIELLECNKLSEKLGRSKVSKVHLAIYQREMFLRMRVLQLSFAGRKVSTLRFEARYTLL